MARGRVILHLLLGDEKKAAFGKGKGQEPSVKSRSNDFPDIFGNQLPRALSRETAPWFLNWNERTAHREGGRCPGIDPRTGTVSSRGDWTEASESRSFNKEDLALESPSLFIGKGLSQKRK